MDWLKMSLNFLPRVLNVNLSKVDKAISSIFEGIHLKKVTLLIAANQTISLFCNWNLNLRKQTLCSAQHRSIILLNIKI